MPQTAIPNVGLPQTAIPNVGLPQTAIPNAQPLINSTGLTNFLQANPTLAQIPLPSNVNPLAQSGAGSAMQSLQPLITGLNAQRPTTSTTTKQEETNWMSAAQPLASLGAAALPILLSSARYKRNITALDKDEYDAALKRVRETPITRYRYKWEGEQGPPHIGPILELAPPEITDDGHRVNLLDYAGLQHAALKAVDRKVENLSRTLLEMVKKEDGTYHAA